MKNFLVFGAFLVENFWKFPKKSLFGDRPCIILFFLFLCFFFNLFLVFFLSFLSNLGVKFWLYKLFSQFLCYMFWTFWFFFNFLGILHFDLHLFFSNDGIIFTFWFLFDVINIFREILLRILVKIQNNAHIYKYYCANYYTNYGNFDLFSGILIKLFVKYRHFSDISPIFPNSKNVICERGKDD